jgi:hypothetical protein
VYSPTAFYGSKSPYFTASFLLRFFTQRRRETMIFKPGAVYPLNFSCDAPFIVPIAVVQNVSLSLTLRFKESRKEKEK